MKEPNWKFVNFIIEEDGNDKKITFEDLMELEKEGYVVEIRLVKPEVVKELSIEFELIEEKK